MEEDAFRCGVGATCRCLTLLIHLEGEGDDGEATGEDLAFTASTSGFNLIVASSLAPEDIVGGRRRDGEDAAFSSPKWRFSRSRIFDTEDDDGELLFR